MSDNPVKDVEPLDPFAKDPEEYTDEDLLEICAWHRERAEKFSLKDKERENKTKPDKVDVSKMTFDDV